MAAVWRNMVDSRYSTERCHGLIRGAIVYGRGKYNLVIPRYGIALEICKLALNHTNVSRTAMHRRKLPAVLLFTYSSP